MTSDSNEELVRRYWNEAWNQGDVQMLEEFYAPTFLHDDGQPFTRERFKRRITSTRESFPDFHVSIEDLFSAGKERVVCRVIYTGTMLGPMGGASPTGKKMKATGIDIFKFQDGNVIEHWHEADHLAMMEQLGLIPE